MARYSALFALVFIVSSLRASDDDVARCAREMAETANNFLMSLKDEQRTKVVYELGSEERLNWHFVPYDRKGLPIREMTATQRPLAIALLSSGLSSRGVINAVTVASLEEILADVEKGKGPKRDPEGYCVTIFGKPGPDATWGWRYEGHHLSLNFSIIEGKKISGAPAFMGSNPQNVLDGPRKGQRLLGEVEDAGRKVILALNDEQKKKAIFLAKAPNEIFTKENRKAEVKEKAGIQASEMTAEQKQLLGALIKEYANRFRPELAAKDWERIEKAGIDQIYFGWAGETELKKAHYYRVHGPTFIIEYDNIQNNANHVHSVWRDLEYDFGGDVLLKHYQQSHVK